MERAQRDQRIADALTHLRDHHLFRQRRIIRPVDATHVDWCGRTLVNFSSNNYLGLTHHPQLLAAVGESVAREGFGSAAAPLISGHGPAHDFAEKTIAQWKGSESAVLLPSGYQANLAAIQTAAAIGAINDGGIRFLVDKLAHASLVDAIRGTGEAFRVFPHNHTVKLKRLLQQAPQGQLQVVVTESIFSMDGDAADLASIAKLKAEHDFLLILDEAHASGVYGVAGAGLAAEMGLGEAVDVTVLTLSKAMGGIGGVVCASQLFCDALVNYARAYLFSTSIPHAVAAAAVAAVGIMRDEPQRQRRLRELSQRVRGEVQELRFDLPAGDSPIVPIILGSEQAAIAASEQLFAEGLLALPVRPPTVPKGSSRLRITLSSQHTDEEVDRLRAALAKFAATLSP